MNFWAKHKLSDLAVVNEKNIDKAYPYNEIEYIDIASVDKGRMLEKKKMSRKEAPSRAQRSPAEVGLLRQDEVMSYTTAMIVCIYHREPYI